MGLIHLRGPITLAFECFVVSKHTSSITIHKKHESKNPQRIANRKPYEFITIHNVFFAKDSFDRHSN